MSDQAASGGRLHPHRTTRITEDQAREAVTHFNNLHFNNPGPKSHAMIPAHQDDDDILLSDYITQRESEAATLRALLREMLGMYPQTYRCDTFSYEQAHIDPQEWQEWRAKAEAALRTEPDRAEREERKG